MPPARQLGAAPRDERRGGRTVTVAKDDPVSDRPETAEGDPFLDETDDGCGEEEPRHTDAALPRQVGRGVERQRDHGQREQRRCCCERVGDVRLAAGSDTRVGCHGVTVGTLASTPPQRAA